MTVLMVTNMYPTNDRPSYGAFIKSQIDSISAIGHEIDVVFIPGYQSRAAYLYGFVDLRRRLKIRQYDVVHAHYGLTGALACLVHQRPLVVSFCGDDLLGTPDGKGGITLKSNVEVYVGQCAALVADRIIVKSSQMLKELKSPNARRKAEVVPNGVDFSLFRPLNRENSRRKLGLSARKKYVLFPSTPYETRKRVDLAKAAIVHLQSTTPDVDLLVVFHRSQRTVADYMSAADVLLLTSDWEGSPNVVKEAMACNLPVVTVDAGDAWDTIEGTAQCFRAERDSSDLAGKLGQVLTSGARSDGRSHISHLELSEVARRVERIYGAAIADHRSAATSEVAHRIA